MRATKYIRRGRFIKGLALLLVVVPVGFLLSGCGSMGPNGSPLPERGLVDPGDSRPSLPSAADDFNRRLAVSAGRDFIGAADYALGPQDLLEINLFNIDGADGLPNKVQVRVGNNGFITLPLLGQVQAGGMTRAQLEESLRKQYGKFMHEPDVGVALAENRSKSVYVLGAVKNPGVFPVTGQETLRRLLATAGGLTRESGMFVHVSRQLAEGEQAYVISLDDLANDKTGKFNLSIRTGDFINVPLAGTFYVDGYVERPNAYPLMRPYTLSQAVTLAGGVSPYGKVSDITVFRRGPKAEVQVLSRDLEKIRSGEEEDIKIAENDIVVVPPSTGKMVLSALLGAVGFSSRSATYGFTVGRAGASRLVLP